MATTATSFKKGRKAGPGRPKGMPNKATKELKDMILGALDESGGVDYLVKRANDPRTASAFLSLIGKVLPMNVQGTLAAQVVHRIELVAGGNGADSASS